MVSKVSTDFLFFFFNIQIFILYNYTDFIVLETLRLIFLKTCWDGFKSEY